MIKPKKFMIKFLIHYFEMRKEERVKSKQKNSVLEETTNNKSGLKNWFKKLFNK